MAILEIVTVPKGKAFRSENPEVYGPLSSQCNLTDGFV